MIGEAACVARSGPEGPAAINDFRRKRGGTMTMKVAIKLAALAAAPASALTMEEFFALPPNLLATAGADVLYDDIFDEVQIYDDGLTTDASITAFFGGLLTPPGTSLFPGADFLGDFAGTSIKASPTPTWSQAFMPGRP
jgi:hypothetical protein